MIRARQTAVILFFLCSVPVFAWEYLKIGGRNISRAEYDRFVRSVSGSSFSETDYSQQFIAYRLKLAEAEALGLNRTQAFKNDSLAFRAYLKNQYFKTFCRTESPDERPSHPDRLLTAHIFVALSPRATALQKSQAAERIQQLYARLCDGADFSEVARSCSDDSFSAPAGGVLPWLSEEDMVPAYAEAVRKLDQDSMYSVPVQTEYGWHIIRLIGRSKSVKTPFIEKEEPSINTGEWIAEQRETLGLRLNDAAFEYLRSIRNTESFWGGEDRLRVENASSVLFSLAGKDYTVDDFSRFVQRHYYRGSRIDVSGVLDRYIDQLILNYGAENPENRLPRFTDRLADYCEAWLVMAVSQRELWNLPISETDLQYFFKKNKKRYSWAQPRFKGWVVQCYDKKIARRVRSRIKHLSGDSASILLEKEFNEDSVKNIRVEKGVYLPGENEIVDREVFKCDLPVTESRFPIVFVVGKMLKRGPDTVDDVRVRIEADYRLYLENGWLEHLKDKFPVEIDEDVLKTVNNK